MSSAFDLANPDRARTPGAPPTHAGPTGAGAAGPRVARGQRHHSIRPTLWKLAIGVALVLLVIIVAEIAGRIRHPSHKIALGHDLLPSYAAGVLVREGRARDMYDHVAVSAAEKRIVQDADLDMDPRYCPWLNPPFYAWVFVPLAALPYREAAGIFLAVNLFLLVCCLALLVRMGRLRSPRVPANTARQSCRRCPHRRNGLDWANGGISDAPLAARASQRSIDSSARATIPPVRTPAALCANEQAGSTYRDLSFTTPVCHPEHRADSILLVLLVLLPLPFWQAMGHQQNTFISSLLLSGAVMCWRGEAPFAAGVLAGLLFFKPQLAAVFAAVLIVGCGWRAAAGLAITGCALLAITLLTLPGCLGDFLHRLPPILHWLQMQAPYNWGRQDTFQSFWRLLLQGHVRGETCTLAKALWWVSSASVLAGLLACVVRYMRSGRDPILRDRLIGAAIVSMPLLMPYYMDYDLLLLAIPGVLLAAEWKHHSDMIRRADYWLMVVWIAAGFESYFNPALAGHTRLNLMVPLLGTVCILEMARVFRK